MYKIYPCNSLKFHVYPTYDWATGSSMMIRFPIYDSCDHHVKDISCGFAEPNLSPTHFRWIRILHQPTWFMITVTSLRTYNPEQSRSQYIYIYIHICLLTTYNNYIYISYVMYEYINMCVCDIYIYVYRYITVYNVNVVVVFFNMHLIIVDAYNPSKQWYKHTRYPNDNTGPQSHLQSSQRLNRSFTS